MNKFLAALAVMALCLAITHATSLTNTRLQARRAAFLEAQNLGMISQDPKEERKIKACYKKCKKTERLCRKMCRRDKVCKKECKNAYKNCKNECEGEGSGIEP